METIPEVRGTRAHTSKSAVGHVPQPVPAPARLTTRLLVRVYRPVVRGAARAALEGRRCDPGRPEAGRFLRADVEAFLEDVWVRVPELLREEDLKQIPTVGNRHNVFLSALTIAAYHALLDRGIERGYATQLFADVGWKVYERLQKIPSFFAQLRTRDLQHRVEFTLKALMRFSFSAPGAPGYA